MRTTTAVGLRRSTYTSHTSHRFKGAGARIDAPINGNNFSTVNNECSQLNNSTTTTSTINWVFETKNSSDLSSGRRIMSKSDELFVSNPIVIKIRPLQLFAFSKKLYHLSEHHHQSTAPPAGARRLNEKKKQKAQNSSSQFLICTHAVCTPNKRADFPANPLFNPRLINS